MYNAKNYGMAPPMQKQIVLDFESKSEADLRAIGAVEYSKHPSTEIICAGYKIEDHPAKIWKPGDDHSELASAINWYKIICHNKLFEHSIIENVLPKYFKLKSDFTHSKFRCTAAKAAALALPRDLERASGVMQLAVQKDMEGNRLIKKYMKPRRKWKEWKENFDKGDAFDWEEPEKYFNDPDELDRIYKYCLTDVETEYLLDKALPHLPPNEEQIWVLNQEMNLRGIQIDIETVKLILNLINHQTKNLNEELQRLTDGVVKTANQRDKFLSWIEEQGDYLSNLQAGTVKAAIEAKTLKPNVQRALEIRRSLSKASTKKYQAMITRAGSDGRVRDIGMYHGDHTGRESGTGIQVKNLPKGKIKNTDQAIEVIQTGDLEYIEMLYGDAFEVFSSCLRGMITATPGSMIYDADYNAIECRILNWLAGETEVLNDFKNGVDLYVKMAKRIGSDNRQLGKTIELACLGAETLVLTDSGWKKIINVKLTDKLWDGVEWVEHQGLKNQGVRETIERFGVNLTPDHLLLTHRGWTEAEAVPLESAQFQKLVSGLAALPFQDISGESVVGSWASKLNVIVEPHPIWCHFTIYAGENLSNVIHALKNLPHIGLKTIGVTKALCPMMAIAEGYLTGLVPQYPDATIKNQNNIPRMVDGELKFIPNGETININFFDTSKKLKGGIIQIWKWIESIIIKGTPPVIFDSFLEMKTGETNARLNHCKPKLTDLKKKINVFDLCSAGPRNRFTILTSIGPIIAHNSGFQMGPAKLHQTCIDWGVNGGKGITEDEAEKAIAAYRKSHPNVVKFWGAMERAAIYAARNPDKVVRTKHGINFGMWKKFLWCELPGGKRLYYFGPEVRQEPTPWGEFRPKLYHWHIENTTKQWVCSATYGGKLCVAEGTRVLTFERGWIPIENVSPIDQVWDGDNWVKQSGVKFNGIKEVIWAYGAQMTSDHLILTSHGWKSASQSHKYKRFKGRLPKGFRISWIKRVQVALENKMQMRKGNNFSGCGINENEAAKSSRILRLYEKTIDWGGQQKAWDGISSGISCVAFNAGSVPIAITPSLEKIWGAWDSSLRKMECVFHQFLGRYGANLQKWINLRSDKQQWELHPEKLPMDYYESTSQQSPQFKKVYDLINCGPQNRFTIWAGGAPLIVHNCENIVQATARNLMFDAALRLKSKGYNLMMTIHDEIVAEAKSGSIEEFENILMQKPAWAKGLPIAVKGWKEFRFRKV